MKRAYGRSNKSAFTLLEVMLSSSLFGVFGLAMLSAVDVAHRSHKTVVQSSTGNQALREATRFLSDELRVTGEEHMTITTLPDGNHQLELQMPIEVGGEIRWGYFDEAAGVVEADRNRLDWSVCYTVLSDIQQGGAVHRSLVRRILDSAGVEVRSQTILKGLRPGGLNSPGFAIRPEGLLWKISLSTIELQTNTQGPRAEFHVRTRN